MSADGMTGSSAAMSSGAIDSIDGRRIGVAAIVRAVGPDIVRALRVLILAGIPTGVLVLGLGGRLAMLALRLTSSSRVDGVESDDGFTIGRFTLFGTYNLLLLGAAIGVLGAAAYQWVRPWLIGPVWFRFLTLALASGAVVGSMLVHADGIDFNVLDPLWFAVALFVAWPAIFAVCIACAVEYVERQTPPTGYRWWLPFLLPLLFPISLVAVVLAALILAAWMAIRQSTDVGEIARKPAVALVMRGLWLGIAVLGLLSLVGDISDLNKIN
jgi:hypothetical protein